ncbi:GON-4-like protein isoform X2 [Nerophis ophidion]|uniref:GON-4-like protein isoform X2 n=1 Tax=Nerophis ophidion TaxID=159077 RepID=UPI002ADFFBD4|nr:GON-4-like protein isoform X2 [Nerophis ophidion]
MMRIRDEETLFSEDSKLAIGTLGDAGLEDDTRPLSGLWRLEDAQFMEAVESSDDELGRLDIDLDRKSRRHNLTSCNVRAILHEVITDERVVAMMKAAIRDTQDMPMFEPKMTRSRLKTAVQQGQCLSWSLSAEKTLPQPHFLNVDLEEDEDSSDEEYCPDEEDEDTAEESFLSDGDIISPPKVEQSKMLLEGLQCSPRHLTSTPQYDFPDACGPSFLERLNAVEEELDCGPAYTTFSSHRTEEEDEGSSGLAFRTRSKLRLVNVPLEQLEAELLAPDITADMYEQSPPQQEEDRHWTRWLHSLMAPDSEEDADDDDDPEYNFLDDLDEPDLEDYRTDRAVQITKREVNELLEELFDTLQEQKPAEEEEEPPAEEEESETGPKFNVPQALCFEPPLAGMLTERRRAVREQYQALQHKRALQDTTNHPNDKMRDTPTPQSTWVLQSQVYPSLHLDSRQKQQLQQQIQQHVQLLTEVHLLCRGVSVMQHEESVTKHFLEELQRFALRQEQLFHATSFRACNLQGALDLLQEVEQQVDVPHPPPAPPATSKRLLPKMTPSSTPGRTFHVLPSDTAWLFATRPVFLYPQLLPVCSLDPAQHTSPYRSTFTAGEDGLIVLALKHFEGSVQPDHLISSHLLCKSAWNLRKHIREMSSSRARCGNVIKTFVTEHVVPALPLACGRVQLGDQRPPVERDPSIMPTWLKNSQEIIQKTKLNTFPPRYPPSLPRGCTLRLYPTRVKQYSPRAAPSHKRLFTLAHNGSLQPICPAEGQGVGAARRLPLHSSLSTTSVVPCPAAPLKASYIIIQREQALEKHLYSLPRVEQEAAEGQHHVHLMAGTQVDTASLVMCALHPTHNDAKWESGGEEGRQDGGQGGDQGGEGQGGEGRGEDGEGKETGEGEDDNVGGQGGHGGGKEEGQGDDDEEEGEEDEGQGGRDREKDDDQERQEEDEEDDEDFDDLTQDEDEEEVMSSASEESVLSVPELQETMKQLTWLASKRRDVADVESEEDHSPTSPGSQEEEEEEEEGPKGEELGEGSSSKVSEDDEPPTFEETPRGGGRGAGGRRGRGRSRPLRGLRRGRQERHSKDATKLSLLYDENILDNDPQRDSKDLAFAQSYLSRVSQALRDVPEKMEEFVSLLNELGQLEGQEVLSVFRKLRCILGSQTELMRDFAAFLHPEQALECGLFQEQQAFERSRRFLRQLEITFGDNPSHYNKIIKALQPGTDLSPASINELKAQMGSLLKGHTHLQAEFWVFFDELRPPPARPGQFEEAHWPEEVSGAPDGGEGFGSPNGGVAHGFEEVTLPDLEEDGPKVQPMASRRQRRKIDPRRSYKESDWSHQDKSCLCRDSKSRRRRRRGCSRCLGDKGSCGVSRAAKSLGPLYPTVGSTPKESVETKVDGSAVPSPPAWEGSFPPAERDDFGEDQAETGHKTESPPAKRKRDEDLHPLCDPATTCVAPSPADVPVCAKNISLTPSGEKVILWTREADRVILTACQQEGANQSTFQSISSLLGNKTPSEVSRRFRDLMCLFQSAARQASSEDEAPPTESQANED